METLLTLRWFKIISKHEGLENKHAKLQFKCNKKLSKQETQVTFRYTKSCWLNEKQFVTCSILKEKTKTNGKTGLIKQLDVHVFLCFLQKQNFGASISRKRNIEFGVNVCFECQFYKEHNVRKRLLLCSRKYSLYACIHCFLTHYILKIERRYFLPHWKIRPLSLCSTFLVVPIWLPSRHSCVLILESRLSYVLIWKNFSNCSLMKNIFKASSILFRLGLRTFCMHPDWSRVGKQQLCSFLQNSWTKEMKKREQLFNGYFN